MNINRDKVTNTVNKDSQFESLLSALPHVTRAYVWMRQTDRLTIGFLNSLGLMHRMKNGWQELSVFMSASRDFLNWVESVGVRLRVSAPMPMSSANSSLRNLLLERVTSCSKSALNVSLFFSRKPINFSFAL